MSGVPVSRCPVVQGCSGPGLSRRPGDQWSSGLVVLGSSSPGVQLSSVPVVRSSRCPSGPWSSGPVVRQSSCPAVRPVVRRAICPVVRVSICPVVQRSGFPLMQSSSSVLAWRSGCPADVCPVVNWSGRPVFVQLSSRPAGSPGRSSRPGGPGGRSSCPADCPGPVAQWARPPQFEFNLNYILKGWSGMDSESAFVRGESFLANSD